MSAETKPAEAAESTQLSGKIGQLGENLTFSTMQRDQSGFPVVNSVWKPELIARAQAVVDRRNVPLETIVKEWEAAWAANG